MLLNLKDSRRNPGIYWKANHAKEQLMAEPLFRLEDLQLELLLVLPRFTPIIREDRLSAL